MPRTVNGTGHTGYGAPTMAGGLNDLELETLGPFRTRSNPTLNASGAKLTRACVPRTVNGTGHHTRPRNSPVADVAPVSEIVEAALPAAPVEPPLLDLLSAPLDFKVSDTAATEMQEVQSVTDAAATLLSTPLEGSETVATEDVQSAVADAAATALVDAMAALKEAQAAVAAAEEPIDIQSVSESERRLQEVEMEEVQAPTPREPEDEEPVQAPTPREPDDAEPEIVTPAITRRRLRGRGGASWWARLSRRLAEATY